MRVVLMVIGSLTSTSSGGCTIRGRNVRRTAAGERLTALGPDGSGGPHTRIPSGCTRCSCGMAVEAGPARPRVPTAPGDASPTTTGAGT